MILSNLFHIINKETEFESFLKMGNFFPFFITKFKKNVTNKGFLKSIIGVSPYIDITSIILQKLQELDVNGENGQNESFYIPFD